MHILLTDLLRCPRCGPDFGLILLGDRIEERRVLDGNLGCPNCRERYPVKGGFLDLRPPPRTPLRSSAVDPPSPVEGDEVVRIGALLGVREGPGYLVLTGGAAPAAPALAGLVDDVEVVAVNPDLRGWNEEPGVSRMSTAATLPFALRRIRGVYLGAPDEEDLSEEEADQRLAGAVGVVGPGSRIVMEGPGTGARRRIEEAGLEVVLDEGGVLVAQR